MHVFDYLATVYPSIKMFSIIRAAATCFTKETTELSPQTYRNPLAWISRKRAVKLAMA